MDSKLELENEMKDVVMKDAENVIRKHNVEEDARFARVDDEKVSCYVDTYKRPLLMVAIKKSKVSADNMVGMSTDKVTDPTRYYTSNTQMRFSICLGLNTQCANLQAARSWKPWWRHTSQKVWLKKLFWKHLTRLR